MNATDILFPQNRAWSEGIRARRPDFFSTLAQQQSPEYLWIGCSDSRVPANEIVGLLPGELFVHRNVANLVIHTDLNCLSVLQYAVDVLQVKHVIVCGHFGCGGVAAAFRDERHGLIDNWLRHIQEVGHRHEALLAAAADPGEALDRLCALNVISQAVNVCHSTVVRQAWARGQALTVHAWIYGLSDGLLQDLGFAVAGEPELDASHARAVARVAAWPQPGPPHRS